MEFEMTMSFLHNRPLATLAILVLVGFALFGCASRHPGADQCADCYIGLGKVLGTNP